MTIKYTDLYRDLQFYILREMWKRSRIIVFSNAPREIKTRKHPIEQVPSCRPRQYERWNIALWHLHNNEASYISLHYVFFVCVCHADAEHMMDQGTTYK